MPKLFAVVVASLFAAVVLFSSLGLSPQLTGKATDRPIRPVYTQQQEILPTDQTEEVEIGPMEIRKTVRQRQKPANVTITTRQRATAVVTTNRTSTSKGKTLAQQVWEALINLTRRR